MQIMNGSLAKFMTLSNEIGGDVAEIAGLAHTAFAAQREVMSVVPATQKPGDKVLEQLFDGTNSAMMDVAVSFFF